MKILKINERKGLYSKDGIQFDSILDITKDEILKILEVIYDNDIEMDECISDDLIVSDAERIIYKKLHEKLILFFSNKQNLKEIIKNDIVELEEKYKA